MGCKAQLGISVSCGDLNFASGADKTFWLGYVSDLASNFSTAQTGFITSMSFKAYSGLVKFEGVKFSHQFSSEATKSAGGNRSIVHKAAIKLLALSTQDDVEVQKLIQAEDVFIVYRNNNNQFFIAGYGVGMSYDPGPVNSTGVGQGDDVSTTINLSGVESTLPLRFLVTDVATTVAYLDARVI